MLATLRSTPFAPAAADLAVELAVETAAALVVVDVVDAPAGRARRIDPGPAPPAAAALRRPAERAAAAGLPATMLRVRAPRPIAALVELVGETAPAIVLLGSDPARLSRLRHLSPRAYRRAARVLEQRTSCLLWRADGEPRACDARRIRVPILR